MNILIVGVGGQGTLLAGKILGKYAEIAGLDCKLNEVHGMAQRGGSVVTHVKMSEKVYSPVIAEGGADVILAFEVLEAFRYRHFLKKDGVIIVNNREIMPMPVVIGAAEYPKNMIEIMKTEANTVAADALAIALEAGSARAVNTVILGIFAKVKGIPYGDIERALCLSVKPKILDINKTALKKGYDIDVSVNEK
ncbi:MAG: indolepyruvate oxidoreductase subunit beta [Clostridiales bacterium]|jgi:indolepyruvate ferredoxin oxidoreductase beta subunit|nr:indolepyruvate oxidoreductase subunit beta [Clostridiales bacterium]